MRFSGATAAKGRSLVTQNSRKLTGAILLLIFIAVYALAAMMVAVVLQVNASKTVEFLYYIFAGLLWVLPAGWLIRWMQTP
jgi:prepilin signal peptidase PulO-like enzyme (type II secretory pathway)